MDKGHLMKLLPDGVYSIKCFSTNSKARCWFGTKFWPQIKLTSIDLAMELILITGMKHEMTP
jgi:hypothetical protein